MINTDKYEGHTPAPWLWCEDEGLDLVVAGDQCRTVIEEVKALNTDADARLMADAPLLLAEVKRLREGIEEMAEYMVAYHEVFPRIKDMAKELKELIE